MKLPFDLGAGKTRRALRLGLQSAAAAAATFLVMQVLELPESFVAILSAVLVLEPSVGNTVQQSRDRVLATLVGSAIGLGCLLALPDASGLWTAASLALSVLVLRSISTFRPAWQYGVVAAVALSLGDGDDQLETAGMRALAIGIGGAIGIVCSLVVWPETARSRTEHFIRESIRASIERLSNALDASCSSANDTDEARRARDQFHDAFDKARAALDGVLLGGTERLSQRLGAAEQLYNSALFLNRVAEETDEAASGGVDLSDEIETIRAQTCELALRLTDEQSEADDPAACLATIKQTLATAREKVAESSSDPKQSVFESALVFGLGEVFDSLEALVGDEGEDEDEDEDEDGDARS